MRILSSRLLLYVGSCICLFSSPLLAGTHNLGRTEAPTFKTLPLGEPKDTLAFSGDTLHALTNADGNWWSDFSRLKAKAFKDISFSGYYRFLGFYRRQPTPMPGVFGNNFVRQGDGYREPLLNLSVNARPSANTAIGTDLYFFSDFQGPGNIDTATNNNGYRALSLNLGLNIYGSINTQHGTFNLKLGGIQWYSLSPFTMGQNRGYNRYSLFDRTPWESSYRTNTRYSNYYNANSLTQDSRWDKQGFQGIVVEGIRLPKDVDFSLLFGKTVFNTGILYQSGARPNFSYGGRVQKRFNGNYVSYNLFTSKTFLDSINRSFYQTQVHSTEFLFHYQGVTLNGELGAGSFIYPETKKLFSLAHSYKLTFPKEMTWVPIEIHYFWIGSNIVNVNSSFINTSVQAAQPKNNINPFSSPMLGVGQLSNNRKGINLNTEFVLGALKISVGNNIATEINGLNNKVSFSHRINSLSWSRFYFYDFDPGSFPNSNVGPYKRLTTVYRGAYETVNLANDTNSGFTKKYFNALDLHFKLSQKIANKELIIFFLSSVNSVQPGMAVIPNLSSKAWIRAYYNELDLSYPIFKKINLLGYVGKERVVGNYFTDIDEVSGKPRNQVNNAYGLGLDFDLAEGAGLYIRNRWYNYQDKSFINDKFKGTETTIELKLFF